VKRALFCAIVAIVTAAPGQAADDTIYSPAQAISMAKSRPAGRSGQFEMVVVSAGKTPNGVFLNSTADYRGDDNLSFRLRLIVADELAKRYGAPMESYLIGKHVVVQGIVSDHPIVNMFSGRPRSLNRFQHEVDVDHMVQLIRVDN
jgi:hypothetical protein